MSEKEPCQRHNIWNPRCDDCRSSSDTPVQSAESVEMVVDGEATDAEPLFGVGNGEPLDHANAEAQYHGNDMSVEARHEGLAHAITEPLDRAYKRGLADGVFLTCLLHVIYGPELRDDHTEEWAEFFSGGVSGE